MKLKPFLLLNLLLVIFACSSDDSNNDDDDGGNTDTVLIKRIDYTSAEDDYSYTETFNYNGNRLMSIIETDSDSSDEDKTIFTYNNDKLVRVDFFYVEDLVEYVTLDYNTDGLLTSFTAFFYLDEDEDPNEVATKHTIIYNDNNSNLELQVLSGDFSSQTEDNGKTILIIDDGNILEIDYTPDVSDDTYILSFEYDTKNSIYKNISDIEIISLIMNNIESGFDISGTTNNVTQLINDQDIFLDTETFSYTYNSDDYPDTAMYYYDGELDYNVEFVYE